MLFLPLVDVPKKITGGGDQERKLGERVAVSLTVDRPPTLLIYSRYITAI